jgi:hypothetical protein
LHGEGDDEGREEGGGALDCEAKLLGYALVDEITAAVDAAWDGARFGGVKIANLLTEGLLEEFKAERPGETDAVDGNDGLQRNAPFVSEI